MPLTRKRGVQVSIEKRLFKYNVNRLHHGSRCQGDKQCHHVP